MNRHRIPLVTPAIRLLLPAVLLLAPIVATGRVLCIGNDGHVAIEGAGPRGDCNDSAGSPALTHSDHHCGGCLDVSISFDEATRSASQQYSAEVTPVLFPSPILFCGHDFGTRNSSPPLPTVPRSNQTDFKIVLII